MTKTRRMINLIIVGIITIILAKLSTFGFRPGRITPIDLDNQQIETSENLKDVVHVLAHKIGERNYASYKNLERTAEYIIDRLKKDGYSIELSTYVINGREFKNIIAEIPGQNKNEDVIIVGAHYDSCFNPGADDNASAVAGMLELARMLRNEKTKRPFRFIAFVNEEPPFFMTEKMGSRVYVRQLTKNNEKIHAAVILEMIGYYNEEKNSQRYLPLLGLFYPNRGNFIAIVGNFTSRRIVGILRQGFKKHSSFPVESLISPSVIPGVNFSDHWSFWKDNYPAVMITDTAYLRNPNYHRQTDLPETLNYKKMAIVIHGLKHALIGLANK